MAGLKDGLKDGFMAYYSITTPESILMFMFIMIYYLI